MFLTFDQIHCIQHYVHQNGLTIQEVQEDIVDHLCCIVEEKLGEGIDFEKSFQAAQQIITQNDIKQIQNDTIYFLTIKKHVIMIKAMFITAYASLVFFVSGAFLFAFGDVLLLPDIIGFAMMLGSATIFSFGFLPIMFFLKYKRYVEGIKA